MNVVLWVLLGLLGAVMLMAGGIKAVKSKDELLEQYSVRIEWPTADAAEGDE